MLNKLFISRSRLLFAIGIFCFFTTAIFFYEVGILSNIFGYSDWDYYSKVLINGESGSIGFVAILNKFHLYFGSAAKYI